MRFACWNTFCNLSVTMSDCGSLLYFLLVLHVRSVMGRFCYIAPILGFNVVHLEGYDQNNSV
ncbi:hypothetical protein JOJ88_003391 [Pantoea cypripedii]|nr:hypothetical protein [Pantoea cypripedii]